MDCCIQGIARNPFCVAPCLLTSNITAHTYILVYIVNHCDKILFAMSHLRCTISILTAYAFVLCCFYGYTLSLSFDLVLHVPGYVSLLLCFSIAFVWLWCVNGHFSVSIRVRVWYYFILIFVIST